MGQVLKGRWIVAATLAVGMAALAGCGYSKGDRIASGAGIGAGVGAAGSALTGGSLLGGAVVGGVVGGAVGGLTDHHDVNLGRPLWR